MTVMLVKNTVYNFSGFEVFFYVTPTGGVQEPLTLAGGIIGTLIDILDAIQLQTNIQFNHVSDGEFVEVVLPPAYEAIDFADLNLGKWIGVEGNNLTGSLWGTSRFMIDDVFLGHESYHIRPYEIESSFTLDGRVYKSTPRISTNFYDITFGDYSKRQVEIGVIPFVENLESNCDMYLAPEGAEVFSGYFNATLFQMNFNKKYLENGDMLNSSKVRLQMSERGMADNPESGTFVVLTDGTFVTDSEGNFLIV